MLSCFNSVGVAKGFNLMPEVKGFMGTTLDDREAFTIPITLHCPRAATKDPAGLLSTNQLLSLMCDIISGES